MPPLPQSDSGEVPVVRTTELDASGEAMMCEGCGSTLTIAAIIAKHGPRAIACCPERKMVEARWFWRKALGIEGPATLSAEEQSQ